MTKEIPEIDDLTRGINDPDMTLSDGEKEKPGEYENVAVNKEPLSEPFSDSTEKYWKDFLSLLESAETKEEKSDRLVCKLDRDLADSLDDCDIHNRCRSDLVNAIVRAFFGTFLSRLSEYRRERKSLFTNFKET